MTASMLGETVNKSTTVNTIIIHKRWRYTSIQELNYFTAQISLSYTHYDYYIYDAAEATDASMTANYRVSERGSTISGL